MRNNSALDQLASDFFREFSRSEYALKAAGFHKGDGNAEVNWSEFAKHAEILVQNPDNEQLSKAIDFVLGHPPKKQIISNGTIQWSDAAPNQGLKADNLLVYVRRVRNNLFHGGKFNGNWFEPERSEHLIQNCLIILKSCVNHVENTRNAYNG